MLENVISLILSGAVFLYSLRFLRYGIAMTYPPGDVISLSGDTLLKVSVIIPVRNEMKGLSALISDLKRQKTGKECFEVVFIDDHSEDGSWQLLEKCRDENENFKFLRLPDGMTGKKAAVDLGVSNADGEWIIQTDADCRLPEDFIHSHSTMAVREGATLIAGPVKLANRPGFWNKLEALDFMSLGGTTMASFLVGKPTMCNGANMSYSKAFYLSVRESMLSKTSPSGDDVFLLGEAKRQNKKVSFLNTARAIVTTFPTGNIRKFMQQRIRWGSKSKYYKDFDLLSLAILVWVLNFMLLVTLILSIFKAEGFFLFLAAWLIKSLVDFLLIFQSARFFNQNHLLWIFFPTAIIYYFYITLAGVFSIIGGFRWKGRAFS